MSAEAAARPRRRSRRVAWRGLELRMLLPLLLLVPLGFAATHIATSGKPDAGPMQIAAVYVILMLAAHFVLVASGQRGD
ncbi:MAG TPA: hypothetical protein VF153_00620, partial [Candidatus Limnocylindria bacterium]